MAQFDPQPKPFLDKPLSRRGVLGVAGLFLLAACGQEKAANPTPSEANRPSTSVETETPNKMDVMTASYEEIKPLTNDRLFGELPEDLWPDNLAKLSLDEIRERLSTRIDTNQTNDEALAQAVVAEIIEKHNAYMRLASADIYEDDISKLEELGVAAWQGMHNFSATSIPKKDITTQWRQTALKYRTERNAKKIAASPVGGTLPEFPTASGVAYDRDSVKLVKRETDGTLIIRTDRRFIIKDDSERVSWGEPAPKIDKIYKDSYRVEVDEMTGTLTWTTDRD